VTFAFMLAHGVAGDWAEAGLAIVAILGFLSFLIALRRAKS
jgi:hypothetical protein